MNCASPIRFKEIAKVGGMLKHSTYTIFQLIIDTDQNKLCQTPHGKVSGRLESVGKNKPELPP